VRKIPIQTSLKQKVVNEAKEITYVFLYLAIHASTRRSSTVC